MKLYNNHNIKAEEPKSTATTQLKTQRIGNYNGVFFSNLCVYTLQNMYLTFTESVPWLYLRIAIGTTC